MTMDTDLIDDDVSRDEAYFDESPRLKRSFDSRLLQEPLTLVPNRPPLVFSATDSVSDAMHAMKKRHRACVVITDDGTVRSPLSGIFTERDVLLKIIDCGKHPGSIELKEVMTTEVESLALDDRLAWALNMMSVGGFRHVPVTDERGWPAFVVSVGDIVEFLVESFPSEILNLPPDFGRSLRRSRDGA